MKNYRLIQYAIIALLFSACTYNNKYNRTIQILERLENDSTLYLSEGEFKEYPLVDDSILNYILTNDKFKNIEELRIEECPNITYMGFRNIEKLKKLEELEISKCENIDSIILHGFITFDRFTLTISECRNLKLIDFNNVNVLFILNANNTIRELLCINVQKSFSSNIYIKENEIGDNLKIVGDSGTNVTFSNCKLKRGYADNLSNISSLHFSNVKSDTLTICDLPSISAVSTGYYRTSEDGDIKYIKLCNLPNLDHVLLHSQKLISVDISNTPILEVLSISTSTSGLNYSFTNATDSVTKVTYKGPILSNDKLKGILNIPQLQYFKYHVDTLLNEQVNIIKGYEDVDCSYADFN